ncbi:hypothetical protein F0562_016386 [Nyssa sinensis]|uniref:Lipin N-terminal domain-containing protein n=1 Tax=Nyssa sinensis TaxID=561372 RepID=A0A5J4ZJI2_9ASTE|nr:hypothetical protein F0562_016386 [Nyssa sinensis]
MNVAGKVASLISQGVYSVATPFHPFGGAVDIIVVQQQDGTFRSTPWYVRFGKFQGVLKGAEKIVRINVNGVEANFHMCLDNSGEAYFIREVVSGKDSEANGVLKVSDSPEGTSREDSSIDCSNNDDSKRDNSVDNMGDSLDVRRLERTESNSERRFYEFQDEQSSFEGSVELSEYGSNRFENLDRRRGLCRIAEFRSSLRTGEEAWATDYIGDLDPSTPEVGSENICNINNDSNSFGHQLEVCEGGGEHVCQAQEPHKITCQVGNADQTEMDSPLEILEEAEDSQENSPHSPPSSMASPNLHIGVDPSDNNAASSDHMGSDNIPIRSVGSDQELADKEMQSSRKEPAPEDDCSKSETMEPQTTNSSEGMKPDSSMSNGCQLFEI